MLYNFIITLKDGSNVTYELDSSYLDITYSDMSNNSPVSMETRKFSIGTTDGKFHLKDLWSIIKKIKTDTIDKISIVNDNIEIFSFDDELENIFYLLNFNGPGDVISFCYGEES